MSLVKRDAFTRGNHLLDDMFASLYQDVWPPHHWGYGSYLPLFPDRSMGSRITTGSRRRRGREWYKTLDLPGFDPDNIKIDMDSGKMIVHANRRLGGEHEGGYDLVEARRILDIPDDMDQTSLRTAMDKAGRMCVIGLRELGEGDDSMSLGHEVDMWPNWMMKMPMWEDNMAIVDDRSGGKKFQMTYDLTGYKPSEIKVKHVGNHVTVHAEHKEEGEGRYIHREFTRTHHLPQGTRADQLTTSLGKDGKMVVTAPIMNTALDDFERHLPIQMAHH